jgi:hypothetical protein
MGARHYRYGFEVHFTFPAILGWGEEIYGGVVRMDSQHVVCAPFARCHTTPVILFLAKIALSPVIAIARVFKKRR